MQEFNAAASKQGFEMPPNVLHIPTMQTLKVDTRKRVLLSGTKHGQVFSRHHNPAGSIVLVPVKEVKPRGGRDVPARQSAQVFYG